MISGGNRPCAQCYTSVSVVVPQTFHGSSTFFFMILWMTRYSVSGVSFPLPGTMFPVLVYLCNDCALCIFTTACLTPYFSPSAAPGKGTTVARCETHFEGAMYLCSVQVASSVRCFRWAIRARKEVRMPEQHILVRFVMSPLRKHLIVGMKA